MSQYLNPVKRSRHHDVVSHYLGNDGKTAQCVERPDGSPAWPRVWDGDWEVGDAPTSLSGYGKICLRCLGKQMKLSEPAPAKKMSSKEKLEKLECEKLERWNRAARDFGGL